MRDFVQDRVSNLLVIVQQGERTGKRDGFLTISTATKATPRVVEMERPTGQAVLAHHRSSESGGVIQVQDQLRLDRKAGWIASAILSASGAGAQFVLLIWANLSSFE